ncbi:MAG: HD domain-containing phosphohydrolase, partial [Candidatus Krumholzibacteria bacterium]
VPLHDIGKVAIPDHILLCPGRLTDEQMAIMRTHAAIGAKTIRSLIERSPDVGFLAMAADIAHYHHEWYNGSGYPEGLKANEIPLSARITAIADVYDGLTTKRVYKEAFRHEKAFAIIVEGSGTQFDPAIVDEFIKREKDFAKLAETMVDEPPSHEDAVLAEPRANAH